MSGPVGRTAHGTRVIRHVALSRLNRRGHRLLIVILDLENSASCVVVRGSYVFDTSDTKLPNVSFPGGRFTGRFTWFLHSDCCLQKPEQAANNRQMYRYTD